MSDLNKKIKLLFITQKIHQDDDDLAFVILWVKELIRQGADAQVVCLEKGSFNNSFPVYSLGKEQGKNKVSQIMKFFKLIFMLKYNRVFVHMNPEYVTLAGWYWHIRRIPIYLWYTHYTMHLHLWLSGILCKRMFAATKQSLPQYNNSEKKVVTGHGIDIDFWLSDKDGRKSIGKDFLYNLVSVHRICRSKRLELAILSLKYLPKEYNLTVYGRDVEKDYYQELQDLVKKEKLENRVKFKGPVPMQKLKKIYPNFKIMVNMAPETIDKTILEGMLFGVYPITTKSNSLVIGLPVYPKDDQAKTIAKFILAGEWKKFSAEYLQNIIKEKHSLPALISEINSYIKKGY